MTEGKDSAPCGFGTCRRPATATVTLEVGTVESCDWHVEGNAYRTLGDDGLPPFSGRLCVWQHCSCEGRWREKERPPNAPLMGTYCDFHWDRYVALTCGQGRSV